MQEIPFIKMHGLGNDFVIIDQRKQDINLNQNLIQRIADRNKGVGFDQLAIILNSKEADAELVFFNSDGSESRTCGNATRCIAKHLMQEKKTNDLKLSTDGIILIAKNVGVNLTSVNMGVPKFEWHDIPISKKIDTLKLPIEGHPTGTSIGNPHCTFFVEDLENIDLNKIGPEIENHPLFPERTNVQFAKILNPNRIRVRVWERGTGVTLASGSSSCAVAVAAIRNEFTQNKVTVDLDGGSLEVNWTSDGVWLTGPTAHSFSGILTKDFLTHE